MRRRDRAVFRRVRRKYMGDGVLVYFGYPQAHEDDAERAVRAGLELVTAVKDLRGRPALRCKARIGIATGLVVVGDLIGTGSAQEQGGRRRDTQPCGAFGRGLPSRTRSSSLRIRGACSEASLICRTSAAKKSKASPNRCEPMRPCGQAQSRAVSRRCAGRH